jgi:hypothetical protein
MAHVLDNPVWNALLSGNKHLAQGTAQAKYFAQDVSPSSDCPIQRRKISGGSMIAFPTKAQLGL